MSKMTEAEATQRLHALQGEFDRWRQSRRGPGERIPEALWAKAVELSRVLPTSRVAKPLRLSQTALRDRRLGKAAKRAKPAKSAPPPVAFVELPGGAPARGGEATAPISVELERADGARLRLRFSQPPAFEALVKRFLA